MKPIQFLLYIFLSITTMQAMENLNNSRSFKAVIFDMDGTILDTERLWQDANRYLLDIYAPHLDEDTKNQIVRELKSMTLQDNRKHLHAHCSVAISMADLQQAKTDYVHALYETQTIDFIPYFAEFHAKVISLNLKHAIATNATQISVHKILMSTPLRNYFGEHIYTIDIVDHAYKPNPDIFLHAAQMIGVEPHNCIVIEDSILGIKAAKAAGMFCIAINTGKNKDLLQQADLIVDCYTEIDLDSLLSK